MDIKPTDPQKLLEHWMEFERGETPPGRVLANLKTGGLRVGEGSSVRPGAGAALYWLSREPSRRAHSFVRNRPRLAGYAQKTLKQVGTLRRH